MLIFVTGKSGVGKSYFAKHLASRLNVKYVNVDELSKTIYNSSQMVNDVKKLLGENVVDKSGNINTKQIGKIIFNPNNHELKQKFYSLTWSMVKELILNQLTESAVLEWSMLPACELWQTPATKILITADDDMRLKKLVERDNVSLEYLRLRDLSAVNFDNFDFDYIFKNDYTDKFVENSVEKLLSELK